MTDARDGDWGGCKTYIFGNNIFYNMFHSMSFFIFVYFFTLFKSEKKHTTPIYIFILFVSSNIGVFGVVGFAVYKNVDERP